MNNLLIVGAGGHGKVIADIAIKENKWNKIAYVDDKADFKTVMGLEVVGDFNRVHDFIESYEIILAVGNNSKRKRIYIKLESMGASIPTLIHPSAIIGTDVYIDKGTVIMPGVVINCCSKIGKGCIINTGATIDHDSNIGDFVHISPGAHLAGTVTIGHDTWIGSGATVSNNTSITGDCVIGASALILKDIIDPGVYIGIPGKKIIE